MSREAVICVMGNSPLAFGRLQELVKREHGLDLCAASGQVAEALPRLKAAQPDVIVIVAGESFPDLKAVMENAQQQVNTPIIVASENNALRKVAENSGAYDFMYIPNTGAAFQSMERELVMRMRLASASRAVTPILQTAPKPSAGSIRTNFNGVLALGASCGGTDAILDVVSRLPANIPGMAIVQHMPPGFTSMYAERLDRESAVNVIEAKGTHKIERGLVLLAPGDIQMRVIKRADGFYTECYDGPKVTGHKPSVDALFHSVAKCAGKNAVGIILTGMGADGAEGLLEMRKQGAYTIGQDERSSIVYGMPKAAYMRGAVATQVPLGDVAKTLTNHLSKI